MAQPGRPCASRKIALQSPAGQWIAISPIPLRQPDQSQTQHIIVSLCWPILRGPPRDANHPALQPRRRRELRTCISDCLTKLLCGLPLGDYCVIPCRALRPRALAEFGFPSQRMHAFACRQCLRIRLSSSSPATILFNRAFSFSRLFSSDNCARPIPPNRFRHCPKLYRQWPIEMGLDTSFPQVRHDSAQFARGDRAYLGAHLWRGRGET